PQGLPGWLLLVIVISLLVWIGLSGVGGMSGSAGFVFAALAMGGLIGVVIWSNHGGEDNENHRFALLPDPPGTPDTGPDSADLTDSIGAAAVAIGDVAPLAADEDLKQIKGIDAEIEKA